MTESWKLKTYLAQYLRKVKFIFEFYGKCSIQFMLKILGAKITVRIYCLTFSRNEWNPLLADWIIAQKHAFYTIDYFHCKYKIQLTWHHMKIIHAEINSRHDPRLFPSCVLRLILTRPCAVAIFFPQFFKINQLNRF